MFIKKAKITKMRLDPLWRGCVPVFALLLNLPPTALAQAVPDAGGVLRETTPPSKVLPAKPEAAPLPGAPAEQKPAPPAAGPRVPLKAVRFSGNTVFSNDELQTLVAGSIGQSLGLSDLEALAQRVSQKYRAAGYMLARAIVPVQDVTRGEVEISVIEGLLGKVRVEVEPGAPIRPEVVERIASRLKPGRPLHGRTLERVMLLISDLPGISPQASLEEGDAGSSDLLITVGPQRRWDLALDADNHGSRSSGEYRAGMTGRVNSPFMIGDNADLRLQLGSGGGLAYGRLGYELPLGADGVRAGASWSRLDYQLGKEFAPLDASGTADVLDLTATYPLIRSRARNLFGKLGWQEKWLDDKQAATGVATGKRLRGLNLGLAYEMRDGWLGGGYTSASASVFAGDLALESESQRNLDRGGLRTEGRFNHFNYAVSRLNALPGHFNLFFGITGQFADKNLDSAEKIALGGPRAVRAYAPSEATVDEGHVANLELRYSVMPELSVHGFYDWGWGRFNHDPVPGSGDNDISLRAFGVGAFWGGAAGFTLRTSLAWRAGERGSSGPDRVPRWYLQLGKAF